MNSELKTVLIIINVGWYFKLHWLDRAVSIKNAGYNVIVICNWRSDSSLVNQIEGLGIRCLDIDLSRRGNNLVDELRSFCSLAKTILKLRPDIIHSVTVKPNLYGGIIASLLSIPLVASITGLGITFSSRKSKHRLAKRFILVWYGIIGSFPRNYFIFENNTDRDLFISKQILPSSRALKIGGAGVDVSLYVPRPEPHTRKFHVLFAARLIKEKGLDQLIEAVSIMQAGGYAIRAKVAGIHDEADLNSLPIELIMQWERQGYLKWLGSCTNMHTVIGESHIVCLPTRYAEGIPRILIEGASCGRPLVAPDVAGCNEVIKHEINGLLYSPGEVNSLVDCLTRLVKDDMLRRAMGNAGRKIVISKYSHDIVVESMLSLYSSLE
jgi:glycosyltransferase involved in cell wall biosynthesis